MKHIIKFNEAKKVKGEECDFQTFKELMFDVSDYYECEFKNEDEYDEEPCYVCAIFVKISDYVESNNIFMSATFYDESEIKSDILDAKIKEIEKNNQKMLEYNKKLVSIIKTINEDIIPRFKVFDNFYSCDIGFNNMYTVNDDEDVIEVYFNLKNSE